MTSHFTDRDELMSCAEMNALERRTDVCSAQFAGVHCKGGRCVDLSGCTVRGAQKCGFFQRCMRNEHLSVDTNAFEQLVTSCETDGLFVAWFGMACVIFVLFIWSATEVVLRSISYGREGRGRKPPIRKAAVIIAQPQSGV